MTDLNPVDAMTNPYRAMCAELIERLEWFIAEDETNENDPGNQYWLTGKQAGIDSVARARALLAQPGPPELTRDELLRCAKIATPDYSNHWGRELEMMRAAITADRARALLASSPDQDDATLKSIREHTPRYRMSVIISTNDCCIDTRMNVIWSALNSDTEILESVSLPEKLPPCENS